MVKMTRGYHRFRPDDSVAELVDKTTKVKTYRHRFRKKAKKSGQVGVQDFKDYSFRKFKNFEEFKIYIKEKFDYD